MSNYCRYETNDGKCKLLSTNEVTEYCVESPCFLRIPKTPLTIPTKIINEVLGDDE